MNLFDKWKDLPKGAKIGIGVAALLVVFLGVRSAKSSKTVVTASPTALVPKDNGGKVGDADIANQLNGAIAALNKKLDDSIGLIQKDVASSIGTVVQQTASNNTAVLSGVKSQIDAVNKDLTSQLGAVGNLAKDAYDKASKPAPVVVSLPTSIPHTEEVETPSSSNQVKYLTGLLSDSTAGEGTKSWANQSLYLENLKESGTVGEKAWAEAELAKQYG